MFRFCRVLFFSFSILLWNTASFSKELSDSPLIVYIHETIYEIQKDSIKEACDFPIILKPFSGANLMSKVLLEGKKIKADIIIGLEGEQIFNVKISSIAASLPSALFENLSLPFKWISSQFLPISYAYLAFLYDQRSLGPNLESLELFLNDLPAKSIVMPDPRTSMIGRGGLSWIDPTLYGRLHNKVLTYPRGWSGSFAFFNKGKTPIMLSYSTSVLYYQRRKQNFIKVALFKKTPHPVQLMVAFIVNKKNIHKQALFFLNLLLTKRIQKNVLRNYSYPVISIPIPKSYEACRPKRSFVIKKNSHETQRLLLAWMRAGYAQ